MVVLDSKMPKDMQDLAKKIVVELKLDNLKVSYDSKTSHFEFVQDRRVVSLPRELAKGEVDEAVRYLFRSILTAPNAKWNRSADTNDWSGRYYYGK